MSDILKTAQSELQNLERELASHPLYKRIKAVRQLIEAYAESPAPSLKVESPTKPAPSRGGRKQSRQSLVADAAARYFQQTGKRAFSGTIRKALEQQGVVIDGKDPNSIVATYLIRDGRFNNVKGEGYGLKEWPVGGSKGPGTQTPDSRELPGVARS